MCRIGLERRKGCVGGGGGGSGWVGAGGKIIRCKCVCFKVIGCHGNQVYALGILWGDGVQKGCGGIEGGG